MHFGPGQTCCKVQTLITFVGRSTPVRVSLRPMAARHGALELTWPFQRLEVGEVDPARQTSRCPVILAPTEMHLIPAV